MPSSNGKPASDQYARERVVTADLASVLVRWRKQFDAEHPPRHMGSQQGKARPEWTHGWEFMGSMELLVEKTGVSHRRIYGVMKEESLSTSFWLADKLLTAIGCSHYLLDGTVRVLPAEAVKVINTTNVKSGEGIRIKSREEWFAYLDQIGCGK